MLNGKIHYFDMVMFNSYVKLPEGTLYTWIHLVYLYNFIHECSGLRVTVGNRLGENVYAVHVHVLKKLQASSVHNVGIIQLPYMTSCHGKHVRRHEWTQQPTLKTSPVLLAMSMKNIERQKQKNMVNL